MSIGIPRGQRDKIVDEIIAALERYQVDNPGARIDVYRQNPASVRVRIIDGVFGGLTKPERHKLAWRYLDVLSEDTQGDISLLLLLAPGETKTSFANFEFDDPTPSNL